MSISDLDWPSWRAFMAVLREGSLSGAARALGVTHPTVRRHLEALESKLGAPLFTRSPSGLAPTHLALCLDEPARALEAAATRLTRAASADTGVIAAAVRVTASEVVGVEVLPPILTALKVHYPNVSVELALTNRIEDVLRHDADIAVRMTRPTQAALLARQVGVIPLGLYAHRDWVARHGVPASLAAVIAAGGLIGYDRDPSIIRAFAAAGILLELADFGFRSDSDLAQIAAVRAGLGVGICQSPLAARDPNLQRVLPAITHALEVWLVVHPNQRNLGAVRTVLDAIAEGLTAYCRSPSTLSL